MSAGTAASVSAAYGTLVYLVSVVGGWLADRDPRLVPRGAVGRRPDRLRPLRHGRAHGRHDLGGPRPDQRGNRPAQAQRRHHGRQALRTDDDRRDAGFALYYMAINIGAFAGPLITGWLGDHQGWHRGFSAAAIGMTFGLIQYVAGPPPPGRTQARGPSPPSPPAARCAARQPADRRRARSPSPCSPSLLAVAGRLTMDRFVDLLTLVFGDRPGRLLRGDVPQPPRDRRGARQAASRTSCSSSPPSSSTSSCSRRTRR